MKVLEQFWGGLVARIPCLVCTRFEQTGLPVELHHVAPGSSIRSEFARVPLCGSTLDGGHHRGGAGLHGMGTDAFCRLYRPPFDAEVGLLVWLMEDVAKYLRTRLMLR